MKFHRSGKYLIDNECDIVEARVRVANASQTKRDSVNGVNEIEKSETVEWAFITGPTTLVRRNRDMLILRKETQRILNSRRRTIPHSLRTQTPARVELITKFVKSVRDSCGTLTEYISAASAN